ncbi:hypothetical protein ANOM_000446 [Aspergillus nomiae NRRL 13137]|uniref:Uncharacterized protein n=1 Tax=Aspergillus nomiae NRRL (strain ATCC 15546 / NRRL 13137 / CBS 260.88 / M93) TaxID=1509407 RepID=A0A0L1JI54_ASPN3|nr:uncharacterized protein ANOM_000446 [Aspergillus nomiae NRRL 13137]KNG91440.1 hypothetical protein ANOM_000446 [Aspergillus nomiae NRRL 13137]
MGATYNHGELSLGTWKDLIRTRIPAGFPTGLFLGTPQSAASVYSFYRNEKCNQEAGLWAEPKSGWVSFNDWFAQECKDIDTTRPLAGPNDEKLVNETSMPVFLGPTDYHRQHAPMGGETIEVNNTQDQVYLQVAAKNGHLSGHRRLVWNPYMITRRREKLKGGHDFYDLDAPDNAGSCQEG